MIPDHLYTWVYNSETSHCGHFAASLWEHLTGNDIKPYLLSSLVPVSSAKIDWKARRIFKRSPVPVEPCLVTMRMPGAELHVGVYVDGCMVQLTEDGVTAFPLDVMPGAMRFYVPVETVNE